MKLIGTETCHLTFSGPEDDLPTLLSVASSGTVSLVLMSAPEDWNLNSRQYRWERTGWHPGFLQESTWHEPGYQVTSQSVGDPQLTELPVKPYHHQVVAPGARRLLPLSINLSIIIRKPFGCCPTD